MKKKDFTTKYPRHEKAIAYALEQIKNSELLPYVKDVVLFGSTARKEEKENSDVDLLLILSDDVQQLAKYQKKCRLLKAFISSDELYDAEVDLKIYIGDEWKISSSTIHQCIREDGVSIWEN